MIGGAGSLGTAASYAGNIAITPSNSLFNYASSATQTLSGVVSGSGALQCSSGLLTLSGSNSYTGGTYVSGGTLVLGSAAAIRDSGSLGMYIGAGAANIQVPITARQGNWQMNMEVSRISAARWPAVQGAQIGTSGGGFPTLYLGSGTLKMTSGSLSFSAALNRIQHRLRQ